MNGEAKKTLIKDLIILAIAGAIGMAASAVFPFGFMITGLPFGWKWASSIISAVSIKGIFIKALFSMFLGLIAVPVVLIKDIIAVVIESKTSGANE